MCEVKLVVDRLIAFKTERDRIDDYSVALDRGWFYP
jgi:hypothetical protein